MSSDFDEGQLNVFKYFVKSLGCRLVDAGEEVPRDLVTLLRLERFMTKLVITFCVNEDLLLLPAWRRSNFIGKGDLTSFAPPEAPSTVDGYQWNEHVSPSIERN